MKDIIVENLTERKMDKTDAFEVTDNNHMTKLTQQTTTKATDKYMESIDLSNACREYYHSRKRAAEVVKEKLASSGRQRTTKKKTSIDLAMEKLRNEMAGLMDQDLSLMKQLLTLNEAIEDLKWQRNYYSSQSSMAASSCDLNESDWSVSETDMYGESDSEDLKKQTTVTSQNNVITRHVSRTADDQERDYLLSAAEEINGNNKDCERISSVDNQTYLVTRDTRSVTGITPTKDLLINRTPTLCHVKQTCFDSGLNANVLRKQITV